MSGWEQFVAVQSALAQRSADAKFFAKGRHNRGDKPDSDDLLLGGEGEDVAPTVFHITYSDTRGELSQRVITIQALERAGNRVRLHCLCHLRGSYRQFLSDRIEEIYDVATGEVFGNATKFLQEHKLYGDVRDPEQKALKDTLDEINILTVVGAADGLFDPDEQDRLLIHVFDRNAHLSLDEGEMRHLLALIAPNETTFHRSLRKLQIRPDREIDGFLRTLRKLVDADGRLHPSEVAFLVDIQNELRRAI